MSVPRIIGIVVKDIETVCPDSLMIDVGVISKGGSGCSLGFKEIEGRDNRFGRTVLDATLNLLSREDDPLVAVEGKGSSTEVVATIESIGSVSETGETGLFVTRVLSRLSPP